MSFTDQQLRYPPPDPDDPFAPLWVLRTRHSNRPRSYSTTRVKPPSLLTDTTSESGTDVDSTPASPIKIHVDTLIHSPSPRLRRPSTAPNPSPTRSTILYPRPSTSSTILYPRPSTSCSYIHIPTPISTPFLPNNPSPLLPTQPEWAIPTPAQLAYAASLPVVAPSGLRIPFGSLFATNRTILIFIRHFWCPLCQDYMSSLTTLARPDIMFAPSSEQDQNQKIELVVISNGAYSFIKKYSQLFALPFSMYTDPSLAVYRALGMGRDRTPKVTTPPQAHDGQKEPVLNGGYVRHSLMGGIAMVAIRAVKAKMPVWEHGGDIAQLGGEFVFGPGLKCTYAHRMQATKGHVPVRDVLEAAGISVPVPIPLPVPLPTEPVPRKWNIRTRKRLNNNIKASETNNRRSVDRGSIMTNVSRPSFVRMTHEEETAWMEERMRNLEQLREKKHIRRGSFVGYCGGCENGVCSPVVEAEEEVVVIGYDGGGSDADNDDESGLPSPTGATEHYDDGDEEATLEGEEQRILPPAEEEEGSALHDTSI